MDKKEVIQAILSVAALVGIVISANAYLAKASDLELVSMRLEQKIVSDAAMQTEARKWQLLDRNNARDCADIKLEKDREECRNLEYKIRELDKKNQFLIEKTAPTIK